MLLVKQYTVMNFENAIRGARNPMNSWDRMDSRYDENGGFVLGENDLALARKLCRAGSDHRKFMRQIFVSADLWAPLYWWKEFDTYKVGTVANSTSTMHKIHSQPFVRADFSCDQADEGALAVLDQILAYLEQERLLFAQTKDKRHWWHMIQILPSSYNQLRTCTLTYENMIHMYKARQAHKLDEWRVFCQWIASLPYADDLICSK